MLRLSLMVVSFSINEVEISVNVLLTVQNYKLVMSLVLHRQHQLAHLNYLLN